MTTSTDWSWAPIAQLFLIGGFPWISQIKELKIHFNIASIDVAGITNFFASLLAVSIFAYLNYAHPIQALDLPPWWSGILCAGILIVIFFAHFLYQKGPVEAGKRQWPVVLHFVLYLLIFVMLTAGFGTLKLLDNHYVMTGRVVYDARLPLEHATVFLVGTSGSTITETVTDADGRFRLLLEKSKMPNVIKLTVTKPLYVEFGKPVADAAHLLSGFREIRMTKTTQQ